MGLEYPETAGCKRDDQAAVLSRRALLSTFTEADVDGVALGAGAVVPHQRAGR